MDDNYTPPTPHDYTRLHELVRIVNAADREAIKARDALVRAWDAQDRGEQCDDSTMRDNVAQANDAVSSARAQWVAEWKRVGSPLSEYPLK